jgi:hypothetical protein
MHVVARPSPKPQCPASRWPVADHTTEDALMNQIIWIVGLVVIVLFILGYLGLR